MPRKLLELLFTISILIIAVTGKSVTITCAQGSQCPSGYTYRLNGSGFSDSVCVPQGNTCNMNLNQLIDVGPCIFDYLSSYCSSKVCFSIVSLPIATTGINCFTSYNENITCASCSYCTGRYCRQQVDFYQNNINPNGPHIECVDGCPTPGNSNLQFNTCASSQDSFGQLSNCCMTFSTAGQVCSASFAPLSSSNFIKWGDSYYFMAVLMNMLFLCLVLQLY
jgi:hypothetical protein